MYFVVIFNYYFLLNFICYAIYKYVAVAAAATGTLLAYVGKTSAHTYIQIHTLFVYKFYIQTFTYTYTFIEKKMNAFLF